VGAAGVFSRNRSTARGGPERVSKVAAGWALFQAWATKIGARHRESCYNRTEGGSISVVKGTARAAGGGPFRGFSWEPGRGVRSVGAHGFVWANRRYTANVFFLLPRNANGTAKCGPPGRVGGGRRKKGRVLPAEPLLHSPRSTQTWASRGGRTTSGRKKLTVDLS